MSDKDVKTRKMLVAINGISTAVLVTIDSLPAGFTINGSLLVHIDEYPTVGGYAGVYAEKVNGGWFAEVQEGRAIGLSYVEYINVERHGAKFVSEHLGIPVKKVLNLGRIR